MNWAQRFGKRIEEYKRQKYIVSYIDRDKTEVHLKKSIRSRKKIILGVDKNTGITYARAE